MEATEAHPPPSSQVTTQTFKDSAQQPLKVFVETLLDITNRPKLIRTLKSGGAIVSDNVVEADILVVSSGTESATQLFESWTGEKVFLDPGWVTASVRRGKAYLQDEDWGGFAVVEGEAGNSGSAEPHPLPTPRETPTEAAVPKENPPVQSNQPPFPNPPQFAHAGSPVPVNPLLAQQMQQMQQQPIPVLQNNPDGSVMIPAQVLAQLLAQAQGANLANMGAIQMPNQMPLNMLAAPPYPPQGYPQQSMPMMLPPGMYPQMAFPHTQQTGMFPPMVQVPFPQQSQQMEVTPTFHTVHSPAPSSPDSHARMYHNGSAAGPSEHHRGREQSGRRSSQRGRRAGSSDSESALPFADDSPSPDRRGSSEFRGQVFVRNNGQPYRFFVQVNEMRTHRNKVADAIKKNGGKLVPLTEADYVILGHPSSKTFAEMLRQAIFFHKPALKAQWVFECAKQNGIVDLKEYLYEEFMVRKKRGRPSNTGQRYVLAEVDPESEDEDDGDDEPRRPSPPKKQKKETAVKKEKKAKVEKTVEKRKTKTSKGKAKEVAHAKDSASKTATSSKSNSKANPPVSESRTGLSPPPPTRVVPASKGNLYTKEDDDYCDEYIPILLSRDPSMTAQAIAQKLEVKMPHHTFRSWQARITTTPRREKLAQMRRRAEILQRKNGGSTSQSHNQASPPRAAASSAATAPPPSNPSNVKDQLRIMIDFFVQGKADQLGDAEVWGAISNEHPQLNAKQWEDLWINNYETVQQEFSRQSNVQPKPEPQ